MGKVELKCPSCGAPVELGQVECRQCGMNLKSGETYEAQRQRARGKSRHPEHFAPAIYGGVIIALALFALAGFLYQRRVERAIIDQSELLRYPALKLQEIDDTIAAQDYTTAREMAVELLDWLEIEASMINPKLPYTPEPDRGYGAQVREKHDDRAAKRLLLNYTAKTQRKLAGIPAA